MIILNDLSFVGQAAGPYAIAPLMRQFSAALDALKKATNDDWVFSHTELYSRPIASGITVYQWLVSGDSSTQNIRVAFLSLSKKGNFIDDRMRECGIRCTCLWEDQDVSYRSVAGAAHAQGRLVSLTGAGPISETKVNVTLCSPTRCSHSVDNISLPEHAHKLDRIYRPSPKHQLGGVGTLMDLDDETAQSLLRAGFLVGSRVYAKHGGKIYAFYDDNAGGFHGFPMPLNEVPAGALKALA